MTRSSSNCATRNDDNDNDGVISNDNDGNAY